MFKVTLTYEFWGREDLHIFVLSRICFLRVFSLVDTSVIQLYIEGHLDYSLSFDNYSTNDRKIHINEFG